MKKNIFMIGLIISIVALCFVIYMIYLEWGTRLVPLLFIILVANIFHVYYYYKNMKR